MRRLRELGAARANGRFYAYDEIAVMVEVMVDGVRFRRVASVDFAAGVPDRTATLATSPHYATSASAELTGSAAFFEAVQKLAGEQLEDRLCFGLHRPASISLEELGERIERGELEDGSYLVTLTSPPAGKNPSE